jgi:hypothetical protein
MIFNRVWGINFIAKRIPYHFASPDAAGLMARQAVNRLLFNKRSMKKGVLMTKESLHVKHIIFAILGFF